MGGFGCILSFIAGFFLIIGLIPFLGWLNWLTTLPLSLVAAIFCLFAIRDQPWNQLARIGLIASVLIFAFGAFRLSLGAGII